MPHWIFLLGPDQWDDGHTLETPIWAHDVDPGPFTPKALRLQAAACIARASRGEILGLVMDPKAQRPDEDDAAFFHRLETEHAIETYFIIVPLQTKVLGTVFEGGMLVRDFQWGRTPRIVLFVQDGFAEEDEDGGFVFTEAGKRTRYLESLANRAHHVQKWDTFETRMDVIQEWAEAVTE